MLYLNYIKSITERKVGIIVTMCLCLLSFNANANSRIKDIADFQGVRDNQLIGYGVVVGLNGTGDNIKSLAFTKESLIGMLERMGVNARDGQLKSKNVAAVMVTANLPAFSRQGSKIDINVSALGDADSLLGGTLLVTPLMGADNEVYAVAQGQIAVGGFAASGDAETVVKGVPTSGRIANGAIVEREIPFALNSLDELKISLRNPDFTTSTRVASAINAYLGTKSAQSEDPGTIVFTVPEKYRSGNIMKIMTDIEQLRVEPDQFAKVVIDEQSGIIVIGKDVRIDDVAIAQGSLTIRVTETPQVSQPAPFSEVGETVTVPRTNIEVDEEEENRLNVVKTGVNLQELVDGLNALGVGPRDMISILQAIKVAGALQADIEIM